MRAQTIDLAMERGWPRIGASAAIMMLMVLLGTSAAMSLPRMEQLAQQHQKMHMVETAAVCSNSISELMPCYDAIKKQGTSSPNSMCCSTLTGWGINCLCTVLSKYASNLPPFVDMAKVLSLPKQCNLDVPKGYQCAGFTLPGT